MCEEGCTGNEIAAALARTPLSVRVKACALGLRLKPEKGKRGDHELRFMLDKRTWTTLRELAKARGSPPSRYAKLLVTIIVRDQLAEQIFGRVVALSVLLRENARTKPAPKRVTMDVAGASSLR
jgi:hypothetical protein